MKLSATATQGYSWTPPLLEQVEEQLQKSETYLEITEKASHKK
jgi:hypothetical protein